jgi:hypothetical protein
LLDGANFVLSIRELSDEIFLLEIGLLNFELLSGDLLDLSYGIIRLIDKINQCSLTGVGTVICTEGESLLALSVPINIYNFSNLKNGLKKLREIVNDIQEVINTELVKELKLIKDEDSVILENAEVEN